MREYKQKLEHAAQYLRLQTSIGPKNGIVLGSGLSEFFEQLDNPQVIPFEEVAGMPLTTVEGHHGAFVFGEYEGKKIVVLRGRLHYYEGYTQQEITIPIRIMKLLGVENVILTNAAGGVNLSFSPGTLMLITDHINYSGANPLIGANLENFGPRFPDMSNVYSYELREQLKKLALSNNIFVKEGVYAMYSGPNYETPAEVRFLRTMGADAVGMSTVPEALVARHSGINVIGISCITNMAAGVSSEELDHSKVVTTANRVKKEFIELLRVAISIL